MLSFGFVFAGLFEILLPIGLAIWFMRKFGTNWGLFGVGVLTFIGSQIVHIPMLSALSPLMISLQAKMSPVLFNLSQAVFLGLAAGICEETARYVGFRLLKNRARTFGSALTVGAGHGGIESILIGLVVLGNFTVMMLASSGASLPPALANQLLPQVPAFLTTPWYIPLVGAAERVFAVTLHLTLSVMVWQAVMKRSWLWFLGALLWHALVDGTAAMMAFSKFPIWQIEVVIGLAAVLNAILLVQYYRRQPSTQTGAAGQADEQAASGGDEEK